MGDKLLWVTVLFALLLVLGLVAGCGDDDDDDDDDDDSADDDDATDDDDTTDDDDDNADPDQVYGDCVTFYTQCAELDETVAQDYCGIITDAKAQGPCYVNAYAAWMACLIDAVDCDNWGGSASGIQECNDQLQLDVKDC